MSDGYKLRGRCREMSEALVVDDPSLLLVRGWYDDPIWGPQEHWWCKRADGTIVDPTSSQFPVGGVSEWYREFTGMYPCAECGGEFTEGTGYEMCCSGECYGRMVGVPFTAAGGAR